MRKSCDKKESEEIKNDKGQEKSRKKKGKEDRRRRIYEKIIITRGK